MHCHILEHEHHDTMRPLIITDKDCEQKNLLKKNRPSSP